MGQAIGIGKATISYDDFAKAQLIIIMGQNPGTNHPRMLTALEEAKEAGCEIVAVNPLPEAGLMRYKNPQKVNGILGRGTELADQYLQIRLGGDMALMQALSKRVLDAEAKRPGAVLDHDFLREQTAVRSQQTIAQVFARSNFEDARHGDIWAEGLVGHRREVAGITPTLGEDRGLRVDVEGQGGHCGRSAARNSRRGWSRFRSATIWRPGAWSGRPARVTGRCWR